MHNVITEFLSATFLLWLRQRDRSIVTKSDDTRLLFK